MAITIPHTFVANTKAQASQVNANFSEVASKALDKTGDTMTGTLTTTAVVISGTGASALDVAGGINAGSGNVGIVDTTGKIPAISSTYFASLSGALLTSLPPVAFSGVIAKNSGNQNMTGAAWTMDGEDLDTDTYHDTGANTSRLTVPSGKDGYFLIFAVLNAANSGGNADTGTFTLRKNGTTTLQTQSWAIGATGAGATDSVTLIFVASLVATDYVEILAADNSVDSYVSSQSRFGMFRVGV